MKEYKKDTYDDYRIVREDGSVVGHYNIPTSRFRELVVANMRPLDVVYIFGKGDEIGDKCDDYGWFLFGKKDKRGNFYNVSRKITSDKSINIDESVYRANVKKMQEMERSATKSRAVSKTKKVYVTYDDGRKAEFSSIKEFCSAHKGVYPYNIAKGMRVFDGFKIDVQVW